MKYTKIEISFDPDIDYKLWIEKPDENPIVLEDGQEIEFEV